MPILNLPYYQQPATNSASGTLNADPYDDWDIDASWTVTGTNIKNVVLRWSTSSYPTSVTGGTGGTTSPYLNTFATVYQHRPTGTGGISASLSGSTISVYYNLSNTSYILYVSLFVEFNDGTYSSRLSTRTYTVDKTLFTQYRVRYSTSGWTDYNTGTSLVNVTSNTSSSVSSSANITSATAGATYYISLYAYNSITSTWYWGGDSWDAIVNVPANVTKSITTTTFTDVSSVTIPSGNHLVFMKGSNNGNTVSISNPPSGVTYITTVSGNAYVSTNKNSMALYYCSVSSSTTLNFTVSGQGGSVNCSGVRFQLNNMTFTNSTSNYASTGYGTSNYVSATLSGYSSGYIITVGASWYNSTTIEDTGAPIIGSTSGATSTLGSRVPSYKASGASVYTDPSIRYETLSTSSTSSVQRYIIYGFRINQSTGSETTTRVSTNAFKAGLMVRVS